MINVKLQCLATLTLPSSIYAFYRIKKLKWGLLINMINSLLSGMGGSVLIVTVMGLSFGDPVITNKHILTYIFGLLYSIIAISASFIIPIFYIRKWTISWNRKLLEPTTTTKS